jgi:hypothetical protein
MRATMTTMDDALAPYIRHEIDDITTEVRLAELNLDELCPLLAVLTAARQRVRASSASAVQPDTGRKLNVVRPRTQAESRYNP